MKSGKTLVELAHEIQRQAASKQDFIAPTQRLLMANGGDGSPALVLGGNHSFGIASGAHSQIAEYLGIPYKYYQRMQAEEPQLLAANVNRWLQDSDCAGDKRMVRTLDGKVRALLSDRYRKIENDDIAEAVLPLLLERDMIIVSSEITERRLYIKAVDRSIEKNIPTGARMGDGSHHIFDCLAPAIIIGNSEVGSGSFFVETGIWTRACTNLAIFGAQMRKHHVGARAEISDDVYALLTDETKNVTDAAMFGQVRDIVAGTLNQINFEKNVERLQAATEDRIEADPVQVIEVLGKKRGMTEGERKGVLSCLIAGGDLSRYGLHSAITRHSADVLDYDRATDLERLGGDVIQLAKNDWQAILKEAA